MTEEKIYKPYENWTKFPNIILDNIDDFTGDEFKMLAALVKDLEDKDFMQGLTLSDAIMITGIARSKISKAVRSLLEDNLIIKNRCRRIFENGKRKKQIIRYTYTLGVGHKNDRTKN